MDSGSHYPYSIRRVSESSSALLGDDPRKARSPFSVRLGVHHTVTKERGRCLGRHRENVGRPGPAVLLLKRVQSSPKPAGASLVRSTTGVHLRLRAQVLRLQAEGLEVVSMLADRVGLVVMAMGRWRLDRRGLTWSVDTSSTLVEQRNTVGREAGISLEQMHGQ